MFEHDKTKPYGVGKQKKKNMGQIQNELIYKNFLIKMSITN